LEREWLPAAHNDPTIRRWCAGLLEISGLSAPEVEARLAVLLDFCRAQDCSPQQLVAICRADGDDCPGLQEYLRRARATPANLIVQSFLVHNGINVFGKIVCMPSTPGQVRAEQGAQWLAPLSQATVDETSA
jgi:hypothetical protein